MITSAAQTTLSAIERSQLERKQLAIGAWAQGQPENALIVLDSILDEEMTPRVAAECYVAQAAFYVDAKDWPKSLESLMKAAPFIESAPEKVQACFYNQRANVHQQMGALDAALTDYGGAAAIWEASGDKDYVGAALANVAYLYSVTGDLPQAHENLSRAIAIFTKTQSPSLAQAYDTQANIYLAEGRLESALRSIGLALGLVGENELWQAEFLATQQKIKAKLLELLDLKSVKDLDALKVEMLRQALVEAGGSHAEAGKLIGLSREGVDYLIRHRDELEQFRKVKRVRRKRLFVR